MNKPYTEKERSSVVNRYLNGEKISDISQKNKYFSRHYLRMDKTASGIIWRKRNTQLSRPAFS